MLRRVTSGDTAPRQGPGPRGDAGFGDILQALATFPSVTLPGTFPHRSFCLASFLRLRYSHRARSLHVRFGGLGTFTVLCGRHHSLIQSSSSPQQGALSSLAVASVPVGPLSHLYSAPGTRPLCGLLGLASLTQRHVLKFRLHLCCGYTPVESPLHC